MAKAPDERAARAQALRMVRLLMVGSDAGALVLLYFLVYPRQPTVFMLIALAVVVGAAVVWMFLTRQIERLQDPARPAGDAGGLGR